MVKETFYVFFGNDAACKKLSFFVPQETVKTSVFHSTKEKINTKVHSKYNRG